MTAATPLETTTSDLAIIDVDAHITESHDLWTSRAPAAYRGRMPKVAEVDGKRAWFVDGDVQFSMGTPSSVIRLDGTKSRGVEFFNWGIEDAHAACYDMRERLKLLDRFGLYAQILYPNVAGFGSQNFMKIEDDGLRLACAQVYNDAMAEVQADSGGRLLPMMLMPWWNIKQSVAEVERAVQMGLRGIVMCSDPDSVGLPDLADDAWTPFWEVCNDTELPVNFHIGASETAFNMFGRASWDSMGMRRSLALGSGSLFMENSRVIGNLLFSGVLERFPKIKVVSVESGIGWIPFMLEALDYEWHETGSQAEMDLPMPPSEYFRRQIYGCFWFEKNAPKTLVEAIGEDNLLFETDYPHPTCLYPDVQEYIAEISAGWSETTRRKILQDNAAALYKIELPA